MPLLIVPYGIETDAGLNPYMMMGLLIVPYGIETLNNTHWNQKYLDTFNRTLWN